MNPKVGNEFPCLYPEQDEEQEAKEPRHWNRSETGMEQAEEGRRGRHAVSLRVR